MAAIKKKEISDIQGCDVPQALNLFFTGKCNLNCTYCFVNKEGQEKSSLDIKSIKKSIDLFFAYPGGKKVISFNGGEPLVEWKLLKEAYLYAYKNAKRKKISLDLVIVSNGTLLSQEVVDFLIEHKAILKISIDGGKKTHDMQRPFLKGKARSTFDIVMGNIARIDWRSMPISASMVFTPDSLDDLVNNVRFLVEKGFPSLDIYPDVHATWKKTDIVKLKKTLKIFEKYYISLFADDGNVPFKNSLLDGIVNDVRLEKNRKCPNIQLDCEGNFYVCDKVLSLPAIERKKYGIGTLRGGLNDSQRAVLLSELRNEIAEVSGLKCNDCKYKRYCFCPIGSYIFNKIREDRDKNFWKSFCQVSGLIIGTYVNIAQKLEYNERFVSLYRF